VDEALNIGFFAFHTGWIVFAVVGWAWRATRRWHLAGIAVTLASWFGLGIWYGWGYCPLTEWHWQVRARLGYVDPNSYMQVLARELFGFNPDPFWTDAVTAGMLAIVAVLSVLLNARDGRLFGMKPPQRSTSSR
jgi:hypothetical protein